jgi:hypothetical protein
MGFDFFLFPLGFVISVDAPAPSLRRRRLRRHSGEGRNPFSPFVVLAPPSVIPAKAGTQ